SRVWRVAGAAAIAAISLGVAAGLAIRSVRRWRRNATASAIERVFPQLGQRIRTTVQYGELSTNEIQASGVTGALVAALEDDTIRRAQPLPLDAVVPWKPLAFASLLAAGVGLLLAGASAFDWQWRIAVQRALLSDEPYTRLTVSPGSQSVKEGESLPLEITVEGRIGEHVLLATRRLDEEGAAWSEELLPVADGKEAGRLRLAFETSLAKIRHPLEYRVAAGSAQSETYRIDVRYPLKLVSIEAAIKPPEYTRLPETVADGGDITALVGSHVKLAVELDRVPARAFLEMQDTSSKARREKLPPERIPLAIDGKRLTTEFEVVSDRTFSVIAASADGMELAENKHRLRARQDEAPQVWFESPAEALEVHTLAEVLMRVRVSDDFGLSRAGIMFEVNNEEEYPLLAEDFAAAAEELETAGELTPQTRAALEKVLPLEHFELTQQDSVMYYAFAEDIRPRSPQRTESDLRFIDIRPFRRQYRLIDPMAGAGTQGPQLKSLEELIARQRYALNRAIRLSRVFEHAGQVDLSAVDSLTKFEGELAKSTRELAEGLEARGIDETELLYQAETSMLAAADSLAAGKYDTATLQMRDALKDLIEGRNRLQIFIFKNPDRALLAQLRLFDRLQRQKLRRPKTDEEEAQQLVERLNELADAEDFVYAALAAADPNGSPTNSPGAGEEMTDSSKAPDQTAAEQPAGSQPPADQSAGNQPPAEAGEPSEKKEKSQAGDSAQGSGEGEASDEKPSAATDRRAAMQELEDRQLDAALEAREVEKALENLKAATELSKERMAEAAKAAEAASEALDHGKSDEARTAAGEAKEKFRQLAEQVAALAAKEQADRIAAAQQMAAELARQQEEFKDSLSSSEASGGADGQPRPGEERPKSAVGRGETAGDSAGDGVAAAARQIAEQAETLADVLAAAARADSPQDQESAAKVDALMKSLDLKGLAERLSELPAQVRQEKFADARAAADDGAERAEAAAEQLGALRRAIVSPRVDELAKLEERLAALDERLNELDSEAKITAWHVDADDLAEQLDGAGIEEELRKEFVDEMRQNGWSLDDVRRAWNWNRLAGGLYSAPRAYRPLISRLSASLRARMQELMLGDLTAEGDEPIPPQYQDLVDRYYQLLAAEKQGADKRPPATP
ncbi:MAG TPA: DUF4175 family protein, partial [Pirellulales bacterium]|nr:DUF4175 family protein [Pirellulales bacterium]